MDFIARTLKIAPLFATLAGITASCGSSPGWSTPGAGNGNGNVSGSGTSGAGAGGGAPSSGGLVGGGAGGFGGQGLGADDGGGGGAGGAYSDPTKQANGLLCSPAGSTRTCCQVGATVGTQTCKSSGEFNSWGPCTDSSGTALQCGSVNGCSPGEIDSSCDGGTPGSSGGNGSSGAGSGGGGTGSGSGSGGSGAGSGSGGTPPPPPSLCTDPSVNTEPGILLAYSPPPGVAVSTNGVIKVWVNDEGAPFVAPGEQVDSSSGLVTAPGNRSATAADGLLYEPALYFAPGTPLNGGTPYFPTWIKGQYNNQPPTVGPVQTSCCMDSLPFTGRDKYSVEYVWDVSKMNLGPGTYTAIFVIHDGDRDRGIGCVTIAIN